MGFLFGCSFVCLGFFAFAPATPELLFLSLSSGQAFPGTAAKRAGSCPQPRWGGSGDVETREFLGLSRGAARFASSAAFRAGVSGRRPVWFLRHYLK